MPSLKLAETAAAGLKSKLVLMPQSVAGTPRKKPTVASAAETNGLDLHALALKARGRQDWTADVFYRRLICERKPDHAGAWVQLGHALKEAGFHSRAQEAYGLALALKPLDAEVTLQLGHLEKVRGNLARARELYLEAQRLGHPQMVEIQAELDRLQKCDNSVIFWELPKDVQRQGVRVYLSVPTGQIFENDKSSISTSLGLADYSYSFAMRGFQQALEEMDMDHVVIKNPEYISNINDRSSALINIHLGFYPPERMRILKGAYNINCCAWEFDRLTTPEERTSYHAFSDPVQMLNLADEIWTPAQSATKAIVKAGVTKPVCTVSAPVVGNLALKPKTARPAWPEIDKTAGHVGSIQWQPLAIAPRLEKGISAESLARRSSLRSLLRASDAAIPPQVFLSVFNIHDMRKNIGPLIDGFLDATRNNPEAILLLKASTPHSGTYPLCRLLFEEQLHIASELYSPVVSERVWLTDQILTREGMNSLFDVSSFYLCTSYGEGQNLPLLEAMGRGVVPVSVAHTAMADYIRPDNSIVIPSEEGPFDRRLTKRYGMKGAMTYYCTAADVSAAIVRAMAIDRDQYRLMSDSALETVRSQFGTAPVGSLLNALIERLSAMDARNDNA